VTASDWDEGDNGRIVYSIPGDVGQQFHIDQHGVLSVHTAVDRELYDTFRFPVLAVDGGSPALTGSALVVISVEDVDDERPKFTQREFHFDVVENEAAAGAQVSECSFQAPKTIGCMGDLHFLFPSLSLSFIPRIYPFSYAFSAFPLYFFIFGLFFCP